MPKLLIDLQTLYTYIENKTKGKFTYHNFTKEALDWLFKVKPLSTFLKKGQVVRFDRSGK